MSYYYLIASLPELDLNDISPRIDIDGYIDLVFRNLSESDRKLARYIVLQNDNYNLINVMLAEYHDIPLPAFKTPAIFNGEVIEDYKSRISDFPDYMSLYIGRYKGRIDLLSPSRIEEGLMLEFYSEVESHNNNFLNDYFQFDRTVKQLSVLHNSKVFNVTLSSEFINDLINKELGLDKPKAVLSLAYPFVGELWNAIDGKDPLKIEKVIDSAKWRFVSDYDPLDSFSNNGVFSWLVKLIIWSRWKGLDEEKGKSRFDQLCMQVINDSGIKEFTDYD